MMKTIIEKYNIDLEDLKRLINVPISFTKLIKELGITQDMTGNRKISFLKHLTVHCKIGRCGKKYIIEEVYEIPKPPIERKKPKFPIERKKPKFTTFEINKEKNYVIGKTQSGDLFYFDIDDYEKVSQYNWHRDNFGYLITVTNKKTISLHRLVMSPPDNLVVDHINHHRNDCRKSNLRICTRSDNTLNIDTKNRKPRAKKNNDNKINDNDKINDNNNDNVEKKYEYFAPLICLGYLIQGYEELGVFSTKAEAIKTYQEIIKNDENFYIS